MRGHLNGGRQADLKTRDTADLEVCATVCAALYWRTAL